MILGLEVFDDLGGAIQSDESGNVVERRVLCEKRRVWRSEKLLVCSLKRHVCC